MSDSSFTFRRGVAETLVIVLGVLIALGVDAAWSWRVERVEEREALERLEADFEVAITQIQEGRAGHRSREIGFRRMLDAISTGGVPAGTGELPDSILFRIFGAEKLRPPTGAVTSLITSGEVGIIRNDSLRAELTRWLDDLQSAQDEDAEDRRVYEQFQFPQAWPVSPFRDLIATRSQLVEDLEVSRLPNDASSLLESLEFESMVSWRLVNVTESIEQYDHLEASGRRVLGLIRGELGRE